jgi:hypothetical protein
MKTRYFYFSIIIIIFNALPIKGQSNDTEAALYNIGFGAVFSTVGAIINKKPNETLGKIIKKSIWQGALGGYVTFESKRILRAAQQQNKWEYIWPAKLVNSIGTSIKENSALNKDFWEKWHLNIGFNRLEFTFKDNFSVNYKLMPVAFLYTADAFVRHKFEFRKSIQTGEFIFSTNSIHNNEFINVSASSLPGYLIFEKPFLNNIELHTHEIIHFYQSNDFSVFNTYFNKPIKKWSKKNKTINWLNKNLYPEYHYLILRPAYLLENIKINNYYDNFFEHEAGYYSGTLN